MNACPDHNEMAAFLDSLLSPERTRALREHVRRCRACALALEELCELLDLTWRGPDLESPEQTHQHGGGRDGAGVRRAPGHTLHVQ
uniref:Putative zinc-finger domain-containing protein n=1 Tax=Fundidesulfovibrio putealis TaxID=270496 RepID=A0A7C4EIE2_9BACT